MILVLILFCSKGSSIYTIFFQLFINRPNPSLRFLVQKPLYCRHKILDTLAPKTVTSFIDDPLRQTKLS